MSRSTEKWVDIGALTDIPVRGARLIKTASGCIAVFRTAENEAFAIDNACPHKAGPLAQGIVHDRSVTCPLHNWVIDLETGRALGADEGQVRTYALKLEADRMFLDASSITTRRVA